MAIRSGKIDIGGYEIWKVEKLPTGYKVHYLGDGFTKSLDCTSMKYMHVRNLHSYLLNM